MAVATRIEGDVQINGDLKMDSLQIPSGTLVNSQVSAAADIDAVKLEHRHMSSYSQDLDTESVPEDRMLHIVYGNTGAITSFEAGSSTICAGDATITVDLRKNGVTNSLLTAAIVLDTNNTGYIAEGSTIDTAEVEDGDVLHVIITTAGTSAAGKGVFCTLGLNEDAN